MCIEKKVDFILIDTDLDISPFILPDYTEKTLAYNWLLLVRK